MGAPLSEADSDPAGGGGGGGGGGGRFNHLLPNAVTVKYRQHILKVNLAQGLKRSSKLVPKMA